MTLTGSFFLVPDRQIPLDRAVSGRGWHDLVTHLDAHLCRYLRAQGRSWVSGSRKLPRDGQAADSKSDGAVENTAGLCRRADVVKQV